MTIQNAINEYLTLSKSRLATNTIRTYNINLKKLARFIGNHVELSSVDNLAVEHFLAHCTGKYSPKTCSNIANSIKAFFKYWFARRKTTISHELIHGPRVPEKFPNFISLEDFELIDEFLSEDEYYSLTKKLIVHLLWNTGVRIGELLSLNISDLNRDEQFAYIRTEKTGKIRMIMWNQTCHNLLLKYLGTRISINTADELFQTPNNSNHQWRRGRLTSRTVQRWMKEVGEELGIKMNPHSFRHGKMHYIISNGGSRHEVMTVAGHSALESSSIYTRLNPSEQRKVQHKHLPPEGKSSQLTLSGGLKPSPYFIG